MTDHANELRRYARKIAHPAGDVPSVMLAAAEEIERQTAERLGRTSPQVTPDCQAAVLIRKSSHKPGCMRRTFAPSACSHCCQLRVLACTSAAAAVCVSPADSRAARTSAGVGLRAGGPARRWGWLVIPQM